MDMCVSSPQEVKLCSPDYKEVDVETAVKDFGQRIKNYELAYEPLDHKKDKYACQLNSHTLYMLF